MSTTSVRRLTRSARRVMGGAQGLGVATTAAWGLDHLRSTDAADPAVVVNTSLTWIDVRADATTVVWIHNYWSDAYGIPAPEFRAALLDVEGRTVAEFPVPLAPDATLALDLRAVCTDHDVALPFTGELLLRLEHEQLVAGRPVQVFAEYRRDNGDCSGVHGQYGLLADPVAQIVSAMRVEHGPDTRTGFVVTNAYDGPGAPVDMRAQLAVYNHAGAVLRAALPAVPARGTIVAYADEHLPGLTAHLDGRPGHARIRLACPSSRIATFVESGPDHRRVVNHGTVDRVFDQEPGIPATWTDSGPVASAVAVLDDATDTVITLANVWGPRAKDYTARLDVYTLEGRHRARHEVLVARDGLEAVSVREVLGAQTPAGTFHVEVALPPEHNPGERPYTFDILVGMWRDGRLVAEAQVGSEFSNAPVPPAVRWPDIRRTRIFGRVDMTADRRTVVFLAYPIAGPGDHAPTEPRLTLLSADGTRWSETTRALMPHGGLVAAIDELFPDAAEVLGTDGIGQLRVRDTEARLYGYSWVERDGTATFPFDHLIGG